MARQDNIYSAVFNMTSRDVSAYKRALIEKNPKYADKWDEHIAPYLEPGYGYMVFCMPNKALRNIIVKIIAKVNDFKLPPTHEETDWRIPPTPCPLCGLVVTYMGKLRLGGDACMKCVTDEPLTDIE